MIGTLDRLWRDVCDGAAAPARPMMLGTLGGLGLSTPLIVAVALIAPVGVAVALGAMVQLAAGYALAARLERRER